TAGETSRLEPTGSGDAELPALPFAGSRQLLGRHELGQIGRLVERPDLDLVPARHRSGGAPGPGERLVHVLDLPDREAGDQLAARDYVPAAGQLAEVGERFAARNWVLGTSGNFSVVLGRDPLRLAMTRSGVSKGNLDLDAIVEIDGECTVLRPPGARPSAEAL